MHFNHKINIIQNSFRYRLGMLEILSSGALKKFEIPGGEAGPKLSERERERSRSPKVSSLARSDPSVRPMARTGTHWRFPPAPPRTQQGKIPPSSGALPGIITLLFCISYEFDLSTMLGNNTCTWLRELCRQLEAKVTNNSRN